MDRGAWWATSHGISESDMTEHAHTQNLKLRCCLYPINILHSGRNETAQSLGEPLYSLSTSCLEITNVFFYSLVLTWVSNQWSSYKNVSIWDNGFPFGPLLFFFTSQDFCEMGELLVRGPFHTKLQMEVKCSREGLWAFVAGVEGLGSLLFPSLWPARGIYFIDIMEILVWFSKVADSLVQRVYEKILEHFFWRLDEDWCWEAEDNNL